MKQSIILSGRKIAYDLQRKNVKNINLRIKPDGSLHLSANKYVSQSTINDFLISNSNQIIKALVRFESISGNLPKPIKYNHGDRIPYLGKSILLCVAQGNNSINYSYDKLILTVNDIDDFELKEKIIDKWYKAMAEMLITDLCQNIYPNFADVCKAFPKLKFRKMKSMWGNCRNKSGILTFNTNLVKYPIEAVEYVVYHEFVHFIHQNHSSAFYKELEKYLPDWKIRKQMLSQK